MWSVWGNVVLKSNCSSWNCWGSLFLFVSKQICNFNERYTILWYCCWMYCSCERTCMWDELSTLFCLSWVQQIHCLFLDCFFYKAAFHLALSSAGWYQADWHPHMYKIQVSALYILHRSCSLQEINSSIDGKNRRCLILIELLTMVLLSTLKTLQTLKNFTVQDSQKQANDKLIICKSHIICKEKKIVMVQ